MDPSVLKDGSIAAVLAAAVMYIAKTMYELAKAKPTNGDKFIGFSSIEARSKVERWAEEAPYVKESVVEELKSLRQEIRNMDHRRY